MALALQIFERGGWYFLARWAHIVAGITWIGLLYFFNFVQMPAFAEMEAAARNNAIDKLASRALWWFRWAAVATVAVRAHALILGNFGGQGLRHVRRRLLQVARRASAIATGILFGVTMFLNVWGVIWPNQKIVIANARNVQAGGEADPAAAGAGRTARDGVAAEHDLLAPAAGLHGRRRALLRRLSSLPTRGRQARRIYWAVTLVIWAVLELNALGMISGRATPGSRT